MVAMKDLLVPVDPDGGVELVGEEGSGAGPTVVFVHANVADRRSWAGVLARLEGSCHAVTYDRRGFGSSRPSPEPFCHVDDLLAVLDAVGADQAWLVGASAGGGVALDAALLAPTRVRGLVLLAPGGIGGAPAPVRRPAEEALGARIDAAEAAGDATEVNRLEAWFWLDGPSQLEGRVGGEARALFLAMNAVVIANDLPEGAGASGLDCWARLEELHQPAVVACGELDARFLRERSAVLADRLPTGTYRSLPGVAHLPSVERPDLVADLVIEAVGGRKGGEPPASGR